MKGFLLGMGETPDRVRMMIILVVLLRTHSNTSMKYFSAG